MIRVLGLDPGTRVCGYGVIDVFGPRVLTLVECGTLEPGAGSVEQRLGVLGRDAEDVVLEFRPTRAAVEKAHVGANPYSGLRLAEARGVLIRVLEQASIPTEHYQPSSAKLTVAGHGRATKEQVRAAVMRLLNLAKPPKLDASDALAIAICHVLRARIAA